jgi:hypothetical protein
MIRYRAKVIPLREGRRQEKEARWEYTHAASPAQAHHFLMRRFPYPKYFVEEPVPDPERRVEPFDEGEMTPEERAKLKRCPSGLLELRNSIKKELADEAAASHMYADMATKFTHFSRPKEADTLRLLSGHEALHRIVLEAIVDEITRECG